MKNGLFARIYKKAFVFVVVLLVFGITFGFASLNLQKIKANTQFYNNPVENVMNDWENYTNQTSGNITLSNNGDGTITLNGSNSTITQFVLPLKIDTISTRCYVFIALLNNNTLSPKSGVRLHLSYNNGNNTTGVYAGLGESKSTFYSTSVTRYNVCAVLQIDGDISLDNETLTPFIYMSTIHQTGAFSIDTINYLLGPQMQDLTKVNYIQEPSNISLIISSQINKSFGNELESLIQYTMQVGDEITVDNTGVATTTIDLLTMTDGAHNYKITFINDALSNDYLNIYLYKDNNATIFYNNNLGELSAQNITDFRIWGADAINNSATIISGSALNNDLISKIFVYSTGTNYETGYEAGYNDARANVEEEIQEAFGEGLQQGYQDGYTTGYGEGYDQGAIEGVDTSWIINLFGAIDTFFSIHLFPNLTFGTIFAIPFVLSVAWVIIRILRGGGYGD